MHRMAWQKQKKTIMQHIGVAAASSMARWRILKTAALNGGEKKKMAAAYGIIEHAMA